VVVPFTFTFAVVNGNFVRERLPATNRDTNAAAESFNAKLKDFRAQFRGVLDIKFFLFRVAKIFT
jgi:hypothetical protein